MRKLHACLLMSLDGVVEGPGPTDDFARAGWTMPSFSPELGAYIGESAAQSDGLLLGRVTYQMFRSAFEAQGDRNPSAAMMNGAHKYVVSRTLKQAEWTNSTVLGGDLVPAIQELKAQGNRPLNLSGSVTLVQSLLAHGLLDGLDLVVHPVVVGAGRRLFETGTESPLPLTLRGTRAFPHGVVLLSYAVNAPDSLTPEPTTAEP
ncbi:dihydrofolate reductase family protein [Deinococcus sp. QL22]|uniref:dihydrofolate reductase family protein n=1 Tax=Deinococcus sp. QL22 TaxID=2939437 RepID=UPI002017CFB5|nr:dihydrofolate reductase family protein [Deinococcus sp. QL22]UQN09142.1 dihydrofolate reductase family protein [Deinococcus sp. QL22]